MKPDNFNIQEIIDCLQGTCNSLQDGVTAIYPDMDEDDLSIDDLSELDQQIFQCAECGWWYEVCQSRDKDGENVCDECENED